MSYRMFENRTKNYFKQVRGSLIFKLLSIISSFLIISLMIKYLGKEQYGIWSTLLSIVSWVVLFDVGIGNGLRNKISESLAKDDKKEAQNYISAAYVIIGLISMFLLGIFLVISNFISWQNVFNTSILSNSELKDIVNITAVFLFVNFWLSLINQVFNGLQKTSIVVFNQFLSNAFALISVYILYSYFESSLFNLAFVYGMSLVMSSLLLSLWFYGKNRDLVPRIKNYGKKYVKSITSLGFQFFIIQIAVIVIFTTDKILITQLFGPEYVASYDVVFKLFSVITIVHSLLMAPLWSAYSDAYHREDFAWIRKTIKNQLKLYALFVLGTIVLIFLAKKIIYLWIGNSVQVDNMLIIAMGAFVLVSTWNNLFAYFINATNNLKIQIITSIIAMIINIPLSIFIVKKYNIGTYGIVIGTIISLLFFAVFGSVQSFKLIKVQHAE
ncbi:oligosaccharide flippase family protein [Deferribacteraceae bacterium V6Fe1]|nr:oligosaccharide flippase family protein [Deferribacteraceae bacterium V6Fe1]